MQIVAHRRNLISELQATPSDLGVEVDVRTRGADLIVHHDPFVDGPRFEDWITEYRHSLLILNVKEEGLEQRLLKIMGERGIEEFFFLDQSFPFLVKTSVAGESRCAVRVSEFESVDTAMSLAGRVAWVWVDCFTRFPLTGDDATRLASAGFRLCLVSPELQGRFAEAEIPQLRRLLDELGTEADAVCTKRPDLWR
jgi:hypothetical protein